MSNTSRKNIADRMDIVLTDVGLQLGYRCSAALITVALQKVIQILGVPLTAGAESQRCFLDRCLSVPAIPQRVVNEFYVMCLLMRAETSKMRSKRMEIDFVPDRCGPVIAVHDVLFQVVPVDMESDTFIVLAGETNSDN